MWKRADETQVDGPISKFAHEIKLGIAQNFDIKHKSVSTRARLQQV